MLHVSDLQGLWRRSLIAHADGQRDVTTRVQWLQGPRLFADLRQPAGLSAYAHARSLEDLTMPELVGLASQQGFAGTLGFDGRHFEWARHIDYQPPTGEADAGSLEWQEHVLIERGRDVDYVEHWHRDPNAPQAPLGAALLRDPERGTLAILVRVGNDFMFARDRAKPLPAGTGLKEVLAGATLTSARQALDCEISSGVIDSQGFHILASTLPFRLDAILSPRVRQRQWIVAERDSRSAAVTRSWDIAEIEGHADALLHIIL
jgi:hypothetical protein